MCRKGVNNDLTSDTDERKKKTSTTLTPTPDSGIFGKHTGDPQSQVKPVIIILTGGVVLCAERPWIASVLFFYCK